MKFRLKDVLYNPNRDVILNPLRERKIESLIESINETGWWANVVGRKTSDGKLQLAHGHHRYEALLRVYGKDHEADFIVRDLTDDHMRQMMARENDEVYRNDVIAMMESVQAAVRGLAAGTVDREKLPVPDATVHTADIRYAPSYIPGRDEGGTSSLMAYTKVGLARYLGAAHKNGTRYRAAERVEAALAVLENMERNLWTKETLEQFRRNGTGPILSDRVLTAAKDTLLRAEKVKQNEKAKAEEQRRTGESIQERLKQAEVAKKAVEAEEERLLSARLEAIRKEGKEKAVRIKRDLEENQRKREEAEEKRKQAQREWDANEKARAASLEAQRKAKQDAERRVEAQFDSYVNAFIGQVDLLFTDEHRCTSRRK